MTTVTDLNTGRSSLSAEVVLKIHQEMVRSRILEEWTIKMSKSGEGYFWIGGPGEEAFNVCLGLQVKKGQGPDYDFLHFHYRNSASMVAMGMDPIDAIRQMAMTRSDPHSMGRNFVGHFARRDWNVIPVSSVIETQHSIAPGTALVQKRHGGDGITVVVGGDAGTSEGDFASCMIWSTRPGDELPVLIIVMNNQWGVSTPADTQHAEQNIIDRGKPFGIPGEVVDGNDPVASWHAIARAMDYCRTQRRPYMIEALVSRLHGHSSSSGAARVRDEVDCIQVLENRLLESGIASDEEILQVHRDANAEIEAGLQQVMKEPMPKPEDVHRFTYAPSTTDAVYPNDYTGLPGRETPDDD